MKNSLFVKSFLILLISISLFSCNNSAKENTSESFQCPMDCEDGKVYDTKVVCAVCEMELEPIVQ